MYLVVIAWIYVVLMMSVAEATNTTGTVLGAMVTFVLYGVLPVTLVVYLMGAPGRNKAIKKRRAEELQQAQAAAAEAESHTPPSDHGAVSSSADPDAGGHAAGGAVAISAQAGIAPVREKP